MLWPIAVIVPEIENNPIVVLAVIIAPDSIRLDVYYTLKRVAQFHRKCIILMDEAAKYCTYEAAAGTQSPSSAAGKIMVATRPRRRGGRAPGAY